MTSDLTHALAALALGALCWDVARRYLVIKRDSQHATLTGVLKAVEAQGKRLEELEARVRRVDARGVRS